MLRELTVHHVGADGLLLTLDNQKGYGKLTTERCGGDKLAERLISALAHRAAKVPVTPALRRDDIGYLPLYIDYSHINPQILGYTSNLQYVISRLYRKSVLCPLIGDVTTARIVKSSTKGILVAIHQPYNNSGAGYVIHGFAAFERPPFSASEKNDSSADANNIDDTNNEGGGDDHNNNNNNSLIDVRIIDYDTVAGVLIVTTKTDVVKHGVISGGLLGDNEDLEMKWRNGFSQIKVGDKVEGTVLLTSNDDGSAVLEVLVNTHQQSSDDDGGGVKSHKRDCCRNYAGCCGEMLPHVTADPSSTTTATTTTPMSIIIYLTAPVVRPSSKAAAYPIGSKVSVLVEFAPQNIHQCRITPFVVASPYSEGRQYALQPPIPRLDAFHSVECHNGIGGVAALFPWRKVTTHYKGDDDEEKDDDESAARQRRRRIEEAVDAMERRGDIIPTSPEEFQKMLLTDPNSSYLYTQFMAYYLGQQQVEPARLLAEKALSTIDLTERKERLNLWVAYLNLENLHGTSESLGAVFRRAVQHSDDDLVVYEKLADIFHNTKKAVQELSLARTMVSKFRNVPRVWERLGTVLLEQDKRDQLKRMIKDMTGKNAVISTVDQVLVMEHLAIHEYRRGCVDGGRSMFEALVIKVPKKSDVWAAYLDQELSLLNRKMSQNSVTGTRHIFERITTVHFSPKVMQQFLTRWLSFEQSHGTAADVEKVKAKAREYVDSRISSRVN